MHGFLEDSGTRFTDGDSSVQAFDSGCEHVCARHDCLTASAVEADHGKPEGGDGVVVRTGTRDNNEVWHCGVKW